MGKDWRYKHWMSNSRVYSVFKQARNRCVKQEHPQYKNYWWRWIKFLWKDFSHFRWDMWDEYLIHCKKYWEKNTTLDRINVNWDYCKEDCRWATWKEQANNKRTCVWFNFDGKYYSSIKEFTERNEWYKPSTISHRIWRGLSPQEAITKPISNEIIYDWKIYPSLPSLCTSLWLNYNTIHTRITNLWWSLDKAILTPINKKFRHKK